MPPTLHELLHPIMRRFRVRRLQLLADALHLTAQDHVLDVGGLPRFWDSAPVRPRVTFLNVYPKAPPGLRPGDTFANEIRRVARRYAVQTPDFAFPFEPHFLAPGVQYVPRRWRPMVVRFLTPYGWRFASRPADVARETRTIRLLSCAEVRRLFPDAEIVRERFLGLSKSLLAIRLPAHATVTPDAEALTTSA